LPNSGSKRRTDGSSALATKIPRNGYAATRQICSGKRADQSSPSAQERPSINRNVSMSMPDHLPTGAPLLRFHLLQRQSRPPLNSKRCLAAVQPAQDPARPLM
jgi:hypothetical protein